MILMLDYQHNRVRQRKKEVRDGGEQRGRVGEGGQRRGESIKGGESKAKQGRAEKMRGEQNRTEGEERAENSRGEEGRRGVVEVMMWQRQKRLKEFFVTKDPICKYSHEGKILGSRFDLGLKSGPRL